MARTTYTARLIRAADLAPEDTILISEPAVITGWRQVHNVFTSVEQFKAEVGDDHLAVKRDAHLLNRFTEGQYVVVELFHEERSRDQVSYFYLPFRGAEMVTIAVETAES